MFQSSWAVEAQCDRQDSMVLICLEWFQSSWAVEAQCDTWCRLPEQFPAPVSILMGGRSPVRPSREAMGRANPVFQSSWAVEAQCDIEALVGQRPKSLFQSSWAVEAQCDLFLAGGDVGRECVSILMGGRSPVRQCRATPIPA